MAWSSPLPPPGLRLEQMGNVTMTAMTVLGEAEGESDCGKLAVAWVIANRARDSRWPDQMWEVCLQPWQFSAWNSESPRIKVMRTPQSYVAEKIWDKCHLAATLAFSSVEDDLTKGANHYHARSVQPSWADDRRLTLDLGGHLFYKL